MNVIQQGIITLLKSAVTGQKYELPKDFALDLDETKEIIKKHHLMQLVYVGAVNCGIPSDMPIMKSLFSGYCKRLVRSERQMAEVQRVFRAFDENGIDYIPTKGCNMKALYPKPEMRIMGDADIFIRQEQYPEIEKAMTELGFSRNFEGSNNDVWDNEHLHLELHKHMCSFYNEHYYDDVWAKVKHVEGHRYAFTTEDAFIHIFNHFAKHYRIGGIGCRHVMDLYVYRQAFLQMDEAYIQQEMKKIHLLDFYKNVCILLDVWFAGGSPNDVTETIGQYIFHSGSWGTLSSYVNAKQIMRANDAGKVSNSRLKEVLASVFPPKQHMAERFEILNKAPYLMPVMWVFRGIRALLFRRDNVSKHMDQWRLIEDDKVSDYQKHYKFVGLDVEDENSNGLDFKEN